MCLANEWAIHLFKTRLEKTNEKKNCFEKRNGSEMKKTMSLIIEFS